MDAQTGAAPLAAGRRHLKGHVYTCSYCRTHAALHDYVISTAFHGRHGRGLLIAHVENVVVGKPEKVRPNAVVRTTCRNALAPRRAHPRNPRPNKMQRMLITGLHKVADIRCATCDNVLGWKYERAYEESQIYKEGKYVLEKALLCEERRAR